MRRVSIQKIIIDKNRKCIHAGRAYDGWEETKPTVGEPYKIFCESGAILKTSYVVRISDGYFETMNSCYKLTVLEKEPFDLTGEESSNKTQELILKKMGQL